MSFLRVCALGLLLGLTNVAFASEILRGSWQGERYQFRLSDTFEYVRGDWGNREYDIAVSNTFSYVRGSVGTDFVDLSYSATFEYLRGDVPCGGVDLTASSTFGYVRGTVCGQDVNLEVEDAVATMLHLGLDHVVYPFPHPTRSTILRFIFRNLVGV